MQRELLPGDLANGQRAPGEISGSYSRHSGTVMALNGLIYLIVYLVILGLIFYLIDWLVGQIPMVAPVRVVIRALLALILIVFLLEALGVLAGPPFPRLVR